MAAKLKVFSYSDGFHAWTVAASSRAKALAAFGVTRDLFKDGLAKEIDESADYDAALKAPGQLIERGLTVDVGKIGMAKPAKPSAKEKARRSRLEAVQAELAELDRQHETDTATFDKRRVALDDEASANAARYKTARQTLKDRLRKARDAVG